MILVTGGAGFIGSNLVAALSGAGRPPWVADRLGEGEKWRNLAKHEIAGWIRAEDLAREPEEALDEAGELQAILHMGAISATTERDGDRLIETNFRLSQRLWTWAARRGVRFVYASSAATYGDGSHGFDDRLDGDYLAALRPLNGYGWSKNLFDRWVSRQVVEGRATPPSWAGLKFFNVYGPNEHHKGAQASVVLHLYERLARGEPARLFKSHHPDYEDGGQLRDFVSVEDCVAVMLWMIEQPALSGLFNVGTGRARSFADLAEAVFGALGRTPAIEYVPTPEEIRAKYQYFTEARLDRLRAAGYQAPFLGLEEGVERTVKGYLSQPDPYR